VLCTLVKRSLSSRHFTSTTVEMALRPVRLQSQTQVLCHLEGIGAIGRCHHAFAVAARSMQSMQRPRYVLRQDLGIALTGCSTNRHSRVLERCFDFRHDNRVAATLQQCWPCALLAEHSMATVSFVKLVTSLMGGVGCLGMGSVAVGHKALGISELPERPNQQKREVRASGHKIVEYRHPLFGRQHRFRPHARTAS